MRISMVVSLMILSLNCLGQTHCLGFESGVVRTNINGRNFLEKNDYRTGWTGGLVYQLQLDNNLIFGTGLTYYEKGFNNELIYTDYEGNPIEPLGETITSFNYNYLSIPIKGGFQLGGKLACFVNLGLVSSVLVHASIDEPGIETIIDKRRTNVTERVSRFDLSGLGEIGVSYELVSSLVISTALTYQQSFTSITNENYFPQNEIKHYGTSLTLGLKYKVNY